MLIEDDDGPTFIECFRGMSRGHDIQSDVVEKYVCHLYGMQNTTKANVVRKYKLQNLAHCRKTSEKWKNIQKVNCALLSPCQKVLIQQSRRPQYVSIMWTRACPLN